MINRVARRFTIGQLMMALLVVMIAISAVNVGAVYVHQSEFETADNSVDVAGEQRMLTQRMARYTNLKAAGAGVDGSGDGNDRLAQSAARYESNLEALSEGGEVDGNDIDPAPADVQDQLDVQRQEWDEFHEHVRTVIETEPRNPAFDDAVAYVVENDDALLERSDAVVQSYRSQRDSDRYSDEIDVAARQRMRSQQIVKTALFVDQHAQPGEDDPTVDAARADLKRQLEEYEAALSALEDGGEFDGDTLEAAPPAVRPELEATREVWEPFEEQARVVATESAYNPEFVESHQYVEANANSLLETSDETVTAFSTFIDRQTRLMQATLLGFFALNVVVFAVGGFLTRRYVGTALADVSEAIQTIAGGSLETDVSERTREMGDVYDEETNNELVSLAAATKGMESYLDTVVRQARALARQDFDAGALDEDVPGEFGEALSEMHRDLESLITEMEQAQADAEAAKERADRSREEAEALADALERTAVEFGEVMERAADGDLGVRLDTDVDVESMRSIADSFNEMLESFEDTIAEIQEFADDVAATSEEVTASTQEVTTSSEAVSESIQQIADGADDQHRQLQTVAEEMSQLSATVEEIASQATTVATTAQETAGIGRSGRESAEEAIDRMRALEESTEETVEAVEALEAQFDEITDIVELITDIADETNLLALNANIEAAHSDASSDGFNVVANEVKSLAEETKDSAGEIETLVEGVRTRMSETVEGVRRMRVQIGEGAETVSETVEAFEDVVENVERTNEGVQQIDDATDDQASSTEEAVAMVDESTRISEETSEETASVSAAAEEQAASLDDVRAGMQNLAENATELQRQLEAFDVEHAAGSGDATAEDRPADPPRKPT